jgi:hypothetical protein
MPHLFGGSSRFHGACDFSTDTLQAEAMERQAEIADWLTAMMLKHRLSARAWAEKAGLGKDTVSRALQPGYAHVTSTRTLAKLAGAIGEPTPGGAQVPTAAALFPVVELICEASRAHARLEPEDVQVLAETLRDVLLAIADDPEAQDDERLARSLTRREFRRLRQ